MSSQDTPTPFASAPEGCAAPATAASDQPTSRPTGLPCEPASSCRADAPAPRTVQTTCLVVGAGPAGIAAARELARSGHDVILAEASSLPRHKSCGGMLNAYAQRWLEQVGGVPRSLMLDPAYLHFRFYDWDRPVKKATTLRFVNVDRTCFDEWTMSLLPPAVSVWERAKLLSWEQDECGVVAHLVREGERVDVSCAFLVGADGARSATRRAASTWQQVACYHTVQEFVRIEPGSIEPFFDCIYSRHIGAQYGYGYIVPKGAIAIVGSVFFPGSKGMPELHARALETFAQRYPLGEAVRREAGSATQVRSLSDIIDGRGRVFLAGEAAGLMSPSSGEGISFAFNSGQRCGAAIARGLTTGRGDGGEEVRAARSSYEAALAPIRRNISFRLKMFPIMNSSWGKWLGGCMPAGLVSKVTEHL